ncbi:hypothetical protein BMR05_14010, partial [Methylococcaceae bacterium HT4]
LYNGAGHRVAKTVNNVTTRYINHINFGLPQVAFETDDKYVVKRYYSYGLGRTAAYDWGALDKDKSQYYLYDRPGRNVTATEDSLGKTRNRYKYGSFGENFSSQESYSNDFRYTGEQTESDSGLIYLRARYYDPEIGRFISRDPFSGYMSVPESQNMYAYAHNNPLKFVDPSGECVETLWDVLNVIYDLGKISNGYISGNQYAVSAGYTDLGADLFALAIPGLPAGITKLRGINGFTKSVKPSLSDHKKALKKVQQEVGALPKGKLGKFGSPQAGDRKKGYRLDPPHNGAAKGSAESKYHINWWDYTNGKRGKGGRSGAVSIDD